MCGKWAVVAGERWEVGHVCGKWTKVADKSRKWDYVCKKWAIIAGKKWEIGFCRREVGNSSRREVGSRTMYRREVGCKAGEKWEIGPCKWEVGSNSGQR